MSKPRRTATAAQRPPYSASAIDASISFAAARTGCGVNYNGTYYYYLCNAQGDVVKLIDKTGSTVVEYTYDSWGKLLSTSGSLAETFGAEQPFRYRGYVYDEETGFYYLQSRYYNPEVGRFISADVYLSTGQGVLGHNAYAYCLNNPVNMSDECGCRAAVLREDIFRPNAEGGGGCKRYWSISDFYVDKETEQTLKGAIMVAKDELNIVRFMLNECADTVLLLIQKHGEDAVCDKLAQYIIDDYYNKKGCSLFATRSQLSYEIKTHIDGYFEALSYEGFVAPKAFKIYYAWEVLRGNEKPGMYNSFLLEHCETIEINKLSFAENVYYYWMR